MRASLLLPLIGLLTAAACSAGSETFCQVGSDCPSGVCEANGTCRPAQGTGGGGSGGGSVSSSSTSSSSTSSSSTSTSSSSSSSGSNVCSPNHDGAIDRAEVPLAAGLQATFQVASNVMVSTAGVTQMDGSRTWDLSGNLTGDHKTIVETLPLTGAWYEADFAGATYVSRLSDSQDLLGVFELTQTELLLRGVVSPAPGVTQTKLTYNPPVTVLSFPLTEGKTFMTTSTVSGQASGVAVLYTETYASSVDAHGTLKTPFGDFPVLRIRVDLTRLVGALVTTTRTYLFSAECFGTVASIVSQTNELSAEFTNASEVSRISP